MTLLKIGSTGAEVKTLQEALNKKGYKLVADGIFGQGTLTAVKQFQSKNNLYPDGLVGDKTWAALGYSNAQSTSTKQVDPSVVYHPITNHVTAYKNRPIKYLAIHYTAGSSSKSGSAEGVRNVFVNRQASADFAVDDTTMLQINPDLNNYYCWAVGDTKTSLNKGATIKDGSNKNTISIEICSTLAKGMSSNAANHTGWSYSDAALNNAIKLSKILMKKFNIPIQNVVRHYDISGKLCPGIVGWNDGPLYDAKTGKSLGTKNNSNEWERFKQKLIK